MRGRHHVQHWWNRVPQDVTGRHRTSSWWTQPFTRKKPKEPPPSVTEWVDPQGKAHYFSAWAITAGRAAQGGYQALCGKLVRPTNLIADARSRCEACISFAPLMGIPRS